MRHLIENWRGFSEASKGKTHRRVILNELSDISEDQLTNFPLSPEELEKIKRWAGLEGDPLFLGSGTMGSAYQFGNLVLKITKDYDEAIAAFLIAGKSHPNVYTIKKVAKRFSNPAPAGIEMPRHAYLIVYQIVAPKLGGPDLPDMNQRDIIKTMHAVPDKIYFNWSGNLEDLKDMFLSWIKANPVEVEKEQISKFQSYKEKLQRLMAMSGLKDREADIFLSAWKIAVGFYGADNISSIENVEKTLSSPMFDYVNDVARGLTFLKKNGIHFRDLKTSNVMNENGKLVIIDVGKSSVEGRPELPILGVN
jgi:serine/threonine protein kinase